MGEQCDILVIGGGIHGVGVAQAATAAGYSVILAEKNTLASGTSSKSSKLIHGGLRYLEQGSLRLVRECLQERALLLDLAPELVSMKPFYLPVYESTRRRPWQIRIGLSLYALLGGLRKESTFTTLPRKEWCQLDGLRTDGLACVFEYADAQTDDALLTQAVMRSASELGATVLEHAMVVGAQVSPDGCMSHIEHDGQALSVRSDVIVNASGPWIAEVQTCIDGAPPPLPVDLVQGSHIVFKNGSVRGMYYVEAPQDGRALFVMPWKNTFMMGTTEYSWTQWPDSTSPTKGEVDYLLEVGRHYFGDHFDFSSGNIDRTFAGLRVLPSGDGGTNRKSRETIFQTDRPAKPRLLSIYGGKLTTYRATALNVLKKLRSTLPARTAIAATNKLPLRNSDHN